MENFLDHMIFVFLSAAVIGLLLGVPCFIIEKLDEKFNWNLPEKISNFFSENDF